MGKSGSNRAIKQIQGRNKEERIKVRKNRRVRKENLGREEEIK